MKASIVQPSAIAAVLAALALGSCGEDSKDRPAQPADTGDDPSVIAVRYLDALADGDGPRVCGLMTAAGQKGLTQLPEGERHKTCEAAAAQLGRNSLRIRRPRVRDLRVSGQTATARITSNTPPYDSGVLLRRDRGWKIAYPPAVLSEFDTPPGIRPHEDEDEHKK